MDIHPRAVLVAFPESIGAWLPHGFPFSHSEVRIGVHPFGDRIPDMDQVLPGGRGLQRAHVGHGRRMDARGCPQAEILVVGGRTVGK